MTKPDPEAEARAIVQHADGRRPILENSIAAALAQRDARIAELEEALACEFCKSKVPIEMLFGRPYHAVEKGPAPVTHVQCRAALRRAKV